MKAAIRRSYDGSKVINARFPDIALNETSGDFIDRPHLYQL